MFNGLKDYRIQSKERLLPTAETVLQWIEAKKQKYSKWEEKQVYGHFRRQIEWMANLYEHGYAVETSKESLLILTQKQNYNKLLYKTTV